MSCVTCSSFDPNYKDGYCDYHHRETTPSATCNSEDSRGGGFTKYTCSTCTYFDESYHGGYCDYHSKDTYESSSCSKHRE